MNCLLWSCIYATYICANNGVRRPLWFDFQSTTAVEDQFMFGPDFMVAPILAPATNQTSRTVVFPGIRSDTFTNYFTGEVHHGGTNASVSSKALSTFPLYSIKRAA